MAARDDVRMGAEAEGLVNPISVQAHTLHHVRNVQAMIDKMVALTIPRMPCSPFRPASIARSPRHEGRNK